MKLVSICIPDTSDSTTSGSACPHCLINFTKESDLEMHLDWPSESILKLEENDLNLASSASLPEEPQSNSVNCKKCDRSFSSFKGMRQHHGKIHSEPKKIKCRFCPKKFKDMYAAKYHRKQVHDKSTQIQCHLCEKSLYNRSAFKKHLVKCSARFFSTTALKTISI